MCVSCILVITSQNNFGLIVIFERRMDPFTETLSAVVSLGVCFDHGLFVDM